MAHLRKGLLVKLLPVVMVASSSACRKPTGVSLDSPREQLGYQPQRLYLWVQHVRALPVLS